MGWTITSYFWSSKPTPPSTPPTNSQPASNPPSTPSPTTAATESQPPTKPLAPPGLRMTMAERQFQDLKNMMSLGVLGIVPVLMLMPPRRFNSITMLQGGMMTWAANEQVGQRTGRDLWVRAKRIVAGVE